MEKTRRILVWLMPILLIAIIITGGFGGEKTLDPPLNAKVLSGFLQLRNPNLFVNSTLGLLQRNEFTGKTFVPLIEWLDEIEKQGMQADSVSAEGVKGILFNRYGYPVRALQLVESARKRTMSPVEQEKLLWQKARLQLKLKQLEGLASSVQELKQLDYPDDELAPFSTVLNQRVADFSISRMVIWAVVWVILLFLPALMLEIERRSLERRFPIGSDRIRAFHSFRRSPLGTVLCLFSALTLFFMRVPLFMGIEERGWAAIIHFLVAFVLCLAIHFRLDREVRGAGWSFGDFVLTVFRLNIFVGFFPLVCLITALIIREMAQHLPMWPVFNPIGLGLSFPAIAGSILLLSPWFFPLVFGFSRCPETECPEAVRTRSDRFFIWPLDRSGIYNAFSYGFLTPSQAIVVTSPMVKNFAPSQMEAILAHEEGHLREGHVFLYFLVMFDTMLLMGLYASAFPLEVQKGLLLGPSPLQIIGGSAGFLIFASYLRNLSWRIEYEADSYAAGKVGREAYIQALSQLSEANYQPDQIRESDNRTSHPSLSQRRERLRIRDGSYFEARTRPAFSVLVGLWRARLALEWKLGQDAAVDLCSLDDDLHDVPEDKKMIKMAERHIQSGAECLVSKDHRTLEILFCAQKAAATSVEPHLPADKICLLCSEGMRHSLGKPITWVGKPRGCVLTSSEP